MAKPLRSDDPSPQNMQFSHFGVLNDGSQSKGSLFTSISLNIIIAIVVCIIGAAAKKTMDNRHKLTELSLAPLPKQPEPEPIRPKVIPPKLPTPPVVKVEPPKIKMPEIKLPEPPKPPEIKMVQQPPILVPAPPKIVQPPPAPEPTLADMAMARYQIATKGYDLAMSGHQPGDTPGPDVIDWMRRRLKARLEIVEPKNDRVAFVKEYVELLRREEEFEQRMVKSRLQGVQALLRAQYDRIEAEALLKQIEAK